MTKERQKEIQERMDLENKGATIILKKDMELNQEISDILESMHGTECIIKDYEGNILKNRR